MPDPGNGKRREAAIARRLAPIRAWIDAFKQSTLGMWGFIVAAILLGLSIWNIFASVGTAEDAQDVLRVVAYSGSGLILSVVALALAFVDVGLREVEKRISSETEVMLREFQKRSPVQLVNRPDEIWGFSIRMLRNLPAGRQNAHAYDVTSYLNRLRYEEAVAEAVAEGISFGRVFCFREQGATAADRALGWFYEKVFSGQSVGIEELQTMPEKEQLEFLKAFKEREDDILPEEFTAAHVARLDDVVRRLHKASIRGNLTLKHKDHPAVTDFVGIYYEQLADGLPEDTVRSHCEVMANFKTDPAGETYVAGVHATGTLALGYRELFHNCLITG
jgi:hypothetical protein